MKYRKKTLLVDDDHELLNVISRWLTLKSWDVVTAGDGTEGYRKFLQEKDFSIVITDFNMPHMDGLAMAEKIKEADPYTGIILITGAWIKDLKKERKKKFIDSILHKPFPFKKLDSAIEKTLCKYRDIDLSLPENTAFARAGYEPVTT